MIRMVVDFPAPLGPRNPVTRPAWAVKVTSSTAVNAPYLLVTPSTVIMRSPLEPASGPREQAAQGAVTPHQSPRGPRRECSGAGDRARPAATSCDPQAAPSW